MPAPRSTLTGDVRFVPLPRHAGLRLEVEVRPAGRLAHWRLAEPRDLPRVKLIRHALGFPPII